MSEWVLWVPGRLPGLNELLNGKSQARNGWNAYNQTKQRWTASVILLSRVRGLSAVGPGYWSYLCAEPNQKRDPLNIVAGAVKILEDALVKGGLLENDGWADVLGFVGYWVHRREQAGCLLRWHPSELATKQAMLALLDKEMANESANQASRYSGADVGNGTNHARARAVAGRRP